MDIQKVMFGTQNVSHEVVVRYKPYGEDAYNKTIFEGTLKGCEEFIKTCERNT